MKVLKDLAVSGSITVGQFLQSSINTDKFLVSESGIVKFRSGSQLLGDIGAATSGHSHTFASLISKPTTLSGYGITDAVNSATTITINGTTYDLSANRSFSVAAGLTSFNTRTGAITLSSADVTGALGFTPYNSTNPSGYISGINSGMVTTALGFTPYNSTNPNGYISSITSSNVTAALGYTPYNATNPNGYISSITSGNVTTALGFTPYNATNPSGYITSSGSISGNAATASSTSYLSALSSYVWSASTPATSYFLGITSSFVSSSQGWIDYGSLMTVMTYPGGGGTLQLYTPYSTVYGGSRLVYRSSDYNTGTWTGWKYLLNSTSDPYAYNMNQNVTTGSDVTHAILRASSYVVTPIIYSGGGSITFGNNVGNFLVAPTSAAWAEGISFTMPTTSTWGGLRWRRERGNFDGNWYVGYVGFDSSDDLVFGCNNGGTQIDNILRLTKAGNVSTSGSFTASGDVTAHSDIRVKENILTIDNALEKTLALRGVYYNRTDKENKSQKIGVIAQEVQQVLPQLVQEQFDGMLGVSYGNMAALFIEAIKEQQLQIEELKAKLK